MNPVLDKLIQRAPTKEIGTFNQDVDSAFGRWWQKKGNQLTKTLTKEETARLAWFVGMWTLHVSEGE